MPMTESSKTFVQFRELDLEWEMDRYLVKDLFGKLSIAWYGVIICIAMIVACAIILRNAVKKEGLNLDSFLDYFIFAIPLGIVGARAMYVLANLKEYQTFSKMIAIWEGGLAIYGGVIVGAITVLVVALIKKHKVLAVYDAIVPGLLLAQSIGRWGNFVNGEAFGDPKIGCSLTWAMWVNGTGPVHPTFLYESIVTLVGFLIAMFVVYRFKKVDGQVFAFYLIWYGVGRTIIEGLRVDSLWLVENQLRLAQCIGLASALGGVALFLILSLYGTPRVAPATASATESAGDEKKENTEENAEDEAKGEKAEPKVEKKNDKKAKSKKQKKEKKEKAPAEEKAEQKQEKNDGSEN